MSIDMGRSYRLAGLFPNSTRHSSIFLQHALAAQYVQNKNRTFVEIYTIALSCLIDSMPNRRCFIVGKLYARYCPVGSCCPWLIMIIIIIIHKTITIVLSSTAYATVHFGPFE